MLWELSFITHITRWMSAAANASKVCLHSGGYTFALQDPYVSARKLLWSLREFLIMRLTYNNGSEREGVRWCLWWQNHLPLFPNSSTLALILAPSPGLVLAEKRWPNWCHWGILWGSAGLLLRCCTGQLLTGRRDGSSCAVITGAHYCCE